MSKFTHRSKWYLLGFLVLVLAPVPIWGLTLPTNWVLYVITMPLGFFFLIRSLWVLHRVTR